MNSRIFRAGDIYFYDEVTVYDFVRFIPMLPDMFAWVNIASGVLLGIYILLLTFQWLGTRYGERFNHPGDWSAEHRPYSNHLHVRHSLWFPRRSEHPLQRERTRESGGTPVYK